MARIPAHGLKSVGLTGLEPVTLRLSSACSNQLSYRPVGRWLEIRRPAFELRVVTAWWRQGDSNP